LSIGQTQAFTLNTAAGCDSIVTVTVGSLPSSSSAFATGVCPNETFSYQGQSLAAGTVQAFTLTNAAGCDSVVTVTVFEKQNSVQQRMEKVCPGQSYLFDGESIGIGQSKDFHYSNAVGCDSTLTIAVEGFPALDFTVDSESSCPNKGTGTIDISVLPGGSQAVEYSINGTDFQQSKTFGDLGAGSYQVTVKDQNGCVFAQPAVIEAGPNLEVALEGAYIIPCDSLVVTLAPQLGGDTTGLQLNWSNGAHTPAISTSEAGPVWLEASNHCDETVYREAEVKWADINGEPIQIYVPNVFEPAAGNADNTTFRAFLGNNFTLLEYRLEVYDRWGNMLFETEAPEQGWTGIFREKEMSPGVYVWQLWVKVGFCGREMELYKKGDVTVIR
jgi:hypothetical protein